MEAGNKWVGISAATLSGILRFGSTWAHSLEGLQFMESESERMFAVYGLWNWCVESSKNTTTDINTLMLVHYYNFFCLIAIFPGSPSGPPPVPEKNL